MIDFPALLALDVSIVGQRPHQVHASLDRGALGRLAPSDVVEFSLKLADGDQFELASRYGHDIMALVVATNGLPDYVLMDVVLRKVGGEAYLIASCS